MELSDVPLEIRLALIEDLLYDCIDAIFVADQPPWNAFLALGLVCRDWNTLVDRARSQMFRLPITVSSTTYSTPADVIGTVVRLYMSYKGLETTDERRRFEWGGHIPAFGPYIATLHWHYLYRTRVTLYRSKMDEITELRVGYWKMFRDDGPRYDVHVLREYVKLSNFQQKRRLQDVVVFDVVLQNHLKVLFTAAESTIALLDTWGVVFEHGGPESLLQDVMQNLDSSVHMADEWTQPARFAPKSLRYWTRNLDIPNTVEPEILAQLENDLDDFIEHPDIPYVTEELLKMSGVREAMEKLAGMDAEGPHAAARKQAVEFCRVHGIV